MQHIAGFLLILAIVVIGTGSSLWGWSRLFKLSGYYYTKNKDPLRIAKERYAKGEISVAEFQNIKKNIA